MKIKEIMTHTVGTVSADATIELAAKKMRTRNVGILPVIEESHLHQLRCLILSSAG